MEPWTFERALAHWCQGLAARYAPMPLLEWLLRENLTVGGLDDDASISFYYQRFDPCLSQDDVAAAYQRAREAGRALRFEILAAPPDSLLVTLRAAEGPGWVKEIEVVEPAGLVFQYEPSYSVFEEVRTQAQWQERTDTPSEPERAKRLEGILAHGSKT